MIAWPHLPKTSSQSSAVDTHQREVILDEFQHVLLEFSNYIATRWYLLTVLKEHFTSGTRDLEDSQIPTSRGVVL